MQTPSSCKKAARFAAPALAETPPAGMRRFCSKSVSTGNFQDIAVGPPSGSESPKTVTFYSLLKNNHRAARYIFVRRYEKAPDEVVEVRRAAIRQATAAAVHRLGVVSEKLNQKVKELTEKRKLIIRHIQNFDSACTDRNACTIKKRQCAKVLLELRLEYLELYILHENELCADLEIVRQLVNLFCDEQPENEIRVNFRAIEAAQADFPSTDASKAAFLRQDRFNTYFESLNEMKSSPPTVVQLGAIIRKIQYTTEFRFVYFPETGTTQSEFEELLLTLPSDILSRIEAGVEECRKNNRACGKIIRDRAIGLATYFGYRDEASCSIVFLLLCRHMFSRLYIECPIKVPPRYSAFIEKTDFLRNRAPSQFGDAKCFVSDELLDTSLASFPENHEYKPAVDILDLVIFDSNPLDLCTHINETVMKVHEIANNVAARKDQSEHMLSNDQLIDVFLMVALLSRPEAIRNLICHFDAYITGLGIPQQLEFSLTMMKAVIHIILSTSVTSVCKEI